MAVYWVTFRISKQGDYDGRYRALADAVFGAKEGGKWWYEPTSFMLLKSQLTIDQLAAKVKAALDTNVDMALIGTTEMQAARIVGKLEDEDLFLFMPFAKRA